MTLLIWLILVLKNKEGDLWLGSDDPTSQLIFLEGIFLKRDRSGPTSSLRECNMGNLLLLVNGTLSRSSLPHPAPDTVPGKQQKAQHVFLQHASCSFLRLPHVVITTSCKPLRSQPATGRSLSGTTLRLIKMKHLSHFAVIAAVIYGYQFSFPKFQSQNTHQEGGSKRVRVSWPCKLAVTVICLPSFPEFPLQPACSLHCSFIASLPVC